MNDLAFHWHEQECFEHPERHPVLLGDQRIIRRESGRVETVSIVDRRKGGAFVAFVFIGRERFVRYFTEMYLRSHTIAVTGNVLVDAPVIAGPRLRLPTQAKACATP